MIAAQPLPRRLPAGTLGLLLAVFALALQLAAASVVPWSGLPAAGVDRLIAGSLCHTAAGDDGGTPAAPHHAPDCAVCPLCHAIAHAGALLAAPAVLLAAPALLVARAFRLPPPRAPPGGARFAASARGPPVPL
jgi:hypothetical protein